jgi:hypothetical protein
MAALMCLASALVTKPGGGTVNECLAVNLPMLFRRLPDSAIGTGPIWTFGLFRAYEMTWERENREMIEALPRSALENPEQAATLGREVTDESIADAVRSVLAAERPIVKDVPARQFGENLRGLVSRMLHEESAPLN